MKGCRANEIEFQNLVQKAGFTSSNKNLSQEQLSENLTVLDFYFDYFRNKFHRNPTLREIPRANSLPYLTEQLKIKNDTVKLEDVLQFTESESLEEAITKLNTEYSDKIINITPINNEGIISIEDRVNRYTPIKPEDMNAVQQLSFIDNFKNGEVLINEENYLKTVSDGTLLHNPNEVYTNFFRAIQHNLNVNDFQFLEQEIKAKQETYNSFLNNVEVEETVSPKNGHRMMKIYIPGKQKGWWELQKDNEFGFFSIHMKTATKMADGTIVGSKGILPSTKEERQYLYEAVKELLPEGACISTWGDLTPGGFIGLEKLGQDFNRVGQRLGSDKEDNPRYIPIFQKPLTNDDELILSKNDIINMYNGMINQQSHRRSREFLIKTIDKLINLQGIPIHRMTTEELIATPELNSITGLAYAKAFIFNGEIYINTDNATEDSRLHEMLHLLIGSLKFNKPELYNKIIDKASQFTYSMIDQYEEFPGRSLSDQSEEVAVSELSKWLLGDSLEYRNYFDEAEQQEIYADLYNTLDFCINGNRSIETFENLNAFNYSLNELNAMLDSKEIKMDNLLEDAKQHRILGNLIEDLRLQGKLKEIC